MHPVVKLHWIAFLWQCDALGYRKFSESLLPRHKELVDRRPFRAHKSCEPVKTDEFSSAALEIAASKFKIVTCMSTSCAKKRKELGIDSLSTFTALYTRSKGDGNEPRIVVEEGPCLGSCKMAPCVAVEHEDFVGTVSLVGMTDNEFSDRV